MIWNKIFKKNEENTITEKVSLTDQSDIQNAPHSETIIKEEIIDLPRIFKFDDEVEQSAIENEKEKTSRFAHFIGGLKKSKESLSEKLSLGLTGKKLSIDMLDDLEDILIQSDLGVSIAALLRDKLEEQRFGKDISEDEIKIFLKEEIVKMLKPVEDILTINRGAKPHVITFVGVNGSGKTTTIGKLAHYFKAYGLSVMLAAGDTYRAAATEQLTKWGEHNDIPVIATEQGGDAAGLIYDAYAEAQENGADILLVDTAGRLQNKNNLMQELLKISRVLQKYDAALPHETLLVLDATTGQNAIRQAEIFRDIANISGIVMTKLDGSAKGGVLVGIGHMMKLPIYAVGIGERIEDLRPFHAEDFAHAITGV
ncbi:MAG: signal recognition particle-docking protein FtsY [Pseudomonadota bacterium]